MKYLEVKEFIESLPKSPLVEYSTDIRIDPENLSEPAVFSIDMEADFRPNEDGPYTKCFLEIVEGKRNCNYRVYTLFDFEPGDEEREELAHEILRMMKVFANEQMIKE